jgi:hypothetical protein
LVSKLVSVWLTWDHFYNFVDQDLFLQAMNGQIPSTYCSPFMVNALLAYACSYSDYDEVRMKHGAPSTLVAGFTREAQRPLAHENSQPSLTTAQQLGLLFLAVAVTGDDGTAGEYLAQAVSMCNGLELKYEKYAVSNL